MKTERIGIAWQVSDIHGWGVFGLNLTLQLLNRSEAGNGPGPLLLDNPAFNAAFDPARLERLRPLLAEQQSIIAQVNGMQGQVVIDQAVVLHSLGNQLATLPLSEKVRGHANVGFVFLENGQLSQRARRRGRDFDRILAGSSWNAELLRSKGLKGTVFVSQGIDTDLFRSDGPSRALLDGKFVVFGGGKLELRKGQDMVLAAFKRFHESHPDAVLAANWHNGWPDSALSLAQSPHTQAGPTITGRDLEITKWVTDNGIPADAFLDLGWMSNTVMADTLRRADVALFPNRCEGGTNLVAMETMACGVPCILSANSGHLDIIDGENCYPLTDQQAVSYADDPAGIWRDSSVDEAVASLEAAYSNRDDAKRRGAAGAEFMKGLSWEIQVGKLMDAIEDLL